MKSYDKYFAPHVKHIHAESLPYYTPIGSISLHLGYPDPRTFPIKDMYKTIESVSNEVGYQAYQYCEEQGDYELRFVLSKQYEGINKKIDENNIIITQGTTEALELIPQLLISKGDVIIMEAPTYLWAIRSFNFRQATLIAIPIDENGIRTSLLADKLKELKHNGLNPKFIYVIPDFQNPSGTTMSIGRRYELLDIANEFEALILEDNPYFELRYEGENIPTLFELDKYDTVILAQSFSKTIGPGIRLGWVVGPEILIKQLTRMKQTGACTLLSRAVSRFIQTTTYKRNINRACKIYKKKCDVMNETLKKYCPSEISWEKPKGGFYFWLDIPNHIDIEKLYYKALGKKILFLSGYDFFCDNTKWNSLRLSFSYESEENILIGIHILGDLLKSV